MVKTFVTVETRDICALPEELSRTILASVEEDEEEGGIANAVLDRMTQVDNLWHNMLAPQPGACIPALTRHVTLGERDMLAVAQSARPWWRWVQRRSDVIDAGLASLATGCSAITTLNLSECERITDAGLASLAAGCH